MPRHYRDIYVRDTRYDDKVKGYYCTCSSRFKFMLNLWTKLVIRWFNASFKRLYKNDCKWYEFEFVEYSMDK